MQNDSLEMRICRVERANCALKCVIGFAIGIGSLMIIVAGIPAKAVTMLDQDVVRARKFVLVDRDGTERAILGLLPGILVHVKSLPGEETVALELLAGRGDSKLNLMMQYDGHPSMRLIDKKGKVRLAAGILPNDSPAASWIDNSGKNRLRLALQPDGEPEIVVEAKDGTVNLITRANEDKD